MEYKEHLQSKTIGHREQIVLAIAAKEGDMEAANDLVRANIRFIKLIAKHYIGHGLEYDDLIAEGCVGYIKAIQKFKPEMGTRFITYAGWWIKQAILQAITELHSQVRVPANRISVLEKSRKMEETLRRELHREPARAEVAARMNIEADDIGIWVATYSLNDSCEDSDTTYLDTIADVNSPQPDEVVLHNDFKTELLMVLDKLANREQVVIKMVYGIGFERGYTLEEIGDKLELTRERVRQIKETALRKLREMNTAGELDGIKSY